MSQMVETATRTFTAGAAIGDFILVKLSSGKLAVAGLGDEFLGAIQAKSFADGDIRSVRLKNAQGTQKMVASGAIALGAVVYGRAAGKIDDNSSTSAVRVGIALEAATAANDIVEVLVTS